jgi:hypothetical protein
LVSWRRWGEQAFFYTRHAYYCKHDRNFISLFTVYSTKYLIFFQSFVLIWIDRHWSTLCVQLTKWPVSRSLSEFCPLLWNTRRITTGVLHVCASSDAFLRTLSFVVVLFALPVGNWIVNGLQRSVLCPNLVLYFQHHLTPANILSRQTHHSTLTPSAMQCCSIIAISRHKTLTLF